MKRNIVLISILVALCASVSARRVATTVSEKDFGERFAGNMPAMPADATPEELEALRFLYAYLPLNDLADYSPEFFLSNVRASMRADSEMPWAASVPDREWRHFVLPVRVNNENLDMSRPEFFAELRDRVKGLSISEAILEVNHWCHEKVTYRPSDSRTYSPLATVRSALGRCGEESTFTVAALRSVGIPARQVYTPRWAHTDDNHAWVEAWADGKWHFIGACEPEPVLDLAWFNAPASRGMLMTTKVFGRYDGPEEQLDNNAVYTTINVTEGYAPVRPIEVKVVDNQGRPVPNATVNFSLYNYAEFYPIAVKKTDEKGMASLLAGLGDLVAWASDGNAFGLAKVNSAGLHKGNVCANVVTLNMDGNSSGILEFDLTPPAQAYTLPEVSEKQIAVNDRRKAQEDSIRGAYTATFYTPEQSRLLADAIGLDRDRVQRVMTLSRGNHMIIETFLRNASDPAKALLLLENVSEKDLGDIEPKVLADRMEIEAKNMPDSVFGPYILSPRIANEPLSDFDRLFKKVFADNHISTPAELRRWTEETVMVDTVWNPIRFPMTPEGVWSLKRADAKSRDIFLVAAARSLSIPARINPVNGNVELGMDEILALSETPANDDNPYARLSLASDEPIAPKYYTHFTLSKIVDGLPGLQEYPEDADASAFVSGVGVEPGQYMLLSGRRMADGGVLARASFFKLGEGENPAEALQLRHDASRLSVIGNFNSENLYRPLDGGGERSLLSTTGRGYYVLGFVSPGHEPSAHALNDLSAVRGDMEALGDGKIVVLMQPDKEQYFDKALFPNLPSNLMLGVDPEGKLLRELVEDLHIDAATMPIFVIADTFNRVVWYNQGYNIGLGSQLSTLLNQLK